VVGGGDVGPAPSARVDAARPLIPFGGGIDSIVTVEEVLARGDAITDPAVFVLSRLGDRFDAIEAPAAATGLTVLRAERALDPQILRSAELGFLNGHVPVTGILSAIAVLVAVADGRGAVVMSNEWSASSGNVRVGSRTVNHQWSKSLAFETAFRDVLPSREDRSTSRSCAPGASWPSPVGSPPSSGSTARSAAATGRSTSTLRSAGPRGAAVATSAASST
jgi:hypothetical protein